MADRKRKRSGASRESPQVCLCRRDDCRALTLAFIKLGQPWRARYFRVPSRPKALARGGSLSVNAELKLRRRNRTFVLLQPPADRSLDKRGGKGDRCYYSAIHMHPELIKGVGRGMSLAHTVPASVIGTLNPPWQHDATDKLPGGDYLMVPNFPFETVRQDLADLERKAEGGHRRSLTGAGNREQRSSISPIMDAVRSGSAGEAVAAIEAHQEASESRQDLMHQLAELKRELAEARERIEEAETGALSGQTRATVTSLKWHRCNPDAFRTLYGQCNPLYTPHLIPHH